MFLRRFMERTNSALTKYSMWFNLSRQRIALLLLLMFISVCIHAMVLVITDRYYRPKKWYQGPSPCKIPEATAAGLLSLALAVSNILKELQVTHALCYGTLWGTLRNEKLLPWDNNVDFCIVSSEMEKLNWPEFQEAIYDLGATISYSYRNGEYTIMKGSAEVVLNMFYPAYNQLLHDGWKERFLWFFQDEPLSFPKYLLEAPLPRHNLHGHSMPVPHDSMEILKYLYRTDWWLEAAPEGCGQAL